MARPLRIEFPGALYHVTSRGDRKEDIFADDQDRMAFLDILGDVVRDFRWTCHAWCLMDNHYHLVIETPDANLGRGMRQLNGVYTQFYNRRHDQSGHLFQGRYKAILVDRDAYAMELARYVVLNPVRARLTASPDKWRWSSYRPTVGLDPAPPWFEADVCLALFATGRSVARRRYAQFVAEGIGRDSPWKDLRAQIYLGDERFVTRMQSRVDPEAKGNINVPRAQRRQPAPPLSKIAKAHVDRDDAMIAAHDTGEYSYQQIADFFGVHFTTVGRIVRRGRKAPEAS